MKQKRNTCLLIAAAACIFLVLYAATRKAVPKSGLTVVIQISGSVLHTMSLDQDGKYTAKTSDGHYNVVVVEDQSVRVSEADCANQVCVKTGRIRNPGEVIACMPHRLIVYVE